MRKGVDEHPTGYADLSPRGASDDGFLMGDEMTKTVCEILNGQEPLTIEDANEIANSLESMDYSLVNDWLIRAAAGKIECTATEAILAAIVRGLFLKQGKEA